MIVHAYYEEDPRVRREAESLAASGRPVMVLGLRRPELPAEELLDWADAIVVVTAHRAIDWPRVYERADLVVDTVDSSAGHATRPRQVLRLGAGWSTRA